MANIVEGNLNKMCHCVLLKFKEGYKPAVNNCAQLL